MRTRETSTVCMVGPTAPYRGGISHYTTLLAKELASQREVSVYNFSRMYPKFLFPGTTQLDQSRLEIRVASEQVVDSLAPMSWHEVGLQIARREPERLVFQWWHPFFAPSYRAISYFVRRHSPDTRQVYLCHNVRPHEPRFLDGALIRFAYSGADAFVVHSCLEKERLTALVNGRPICVQAHPLYDVFASSRVDADEARAKLGLRGDVLLFFGYVRNYKGLRYAIEALPHILRERPVTLVVAGEFYEGKREAVALIERLKLSEHVKIFDRYIPNEEVGSFFAAADLVVQPYLSATQSGISQIAFGFGKPVLVTAVGGLPEVVEDGGTGFLVPPADAGAVAQAVVRFFAEGMSEPMMHRVKRVRGRFSWSAMAEAVMSV